MFTILIVDDERIILNGCKLMITELLSFSFPLTVFTAQSVGAAEESLQKEPVDLILVDIRMPVRDGFSLAEYVQAHDLSAELVILTSHASFDYAQKGIRYGVRDFLLKPINEEQLQEVINASHARKEKREEEAMRSLTNDLLTMLLYDITSSDLLMSRHALGKLFPHAFYQVIIAQFSGTVPDSDYAGALASYCEVTRHFRLREQRQLVWICNFPSPASLRGKPEPLLHATLPGNFDCAGSVYSDLLDNLHHLYANAQQKLFYSHVFGQDSDAASASLFSYHDCLLVLFARGEAARSDAADALLDRLDVPDQAAEAFYAGILESFRQNLILYFSDANLTVPAALQDENGAPLNRAALRDAICSLTARIHAETPDNEKSDHDKSTVAHLLDFIRAHYKRDISLEDLAEVASLSPAAVCTLFRRVTGSSYLRFLHEARIQAAKELLSSGDDIMEVIAAQVGYNSTTQLTRVFRKYVQMTPAEYRRKAKA